MLVLGASLALLVLAGVAAALTLRAPAPTTGALSVETDPPGAEVRIDNAVRGTTPLTLNLAEGRHSLVVQHGSNSKQLNVEIAANATNSYHIEWAAAAPLAAPLQTGSLSVLSDPPGSAVTVDGSSRGQTPLTIRDLTAGRHEVLVKSFGYDLSAIRGGRSRRNGVSGRRWCAERDTFLGLDLVEDAFPGPGAGGRTRCRDQ